MRRREFYLESIVIFIVALAVYLIMAWVVVFHMRIFAIDAVARTLQAWIVLYGAEPKLANIGFVWPPLHQMLQLPLILLPVFRENGWSGNIITAFAGTGACVFFNAFLRTYNLGGWVRLVTLLAFALNPMIFYYSINGMSEMVVISLLMFSFYCLRRFEQTHHWSFVGLMGFAMGLAFLTKIEILVIAGFFGLALLVLELGGEARNVARTQATLLVYGVPVAFMLFLWIFANWLIMGHPLYFFVAPGASFTSKYVLDDPARLPFINTPRVKIAYVIDRFAQMFLPYWPFLLLLLVILLLRRDYKLLALATVVFGVFASPLMLTLTGSYLPFLRYYILGIPGAFVLAAPIMRQVSFTRIGGMVIAIVLFLSAASSALAMTGETAFGEMYFISQMSGVPQPFQSINEKQMGDYIAQHVDKRSILSDTLNVPAVILFSGKPWLFVLPGDSDFKQILKNPYGQVDYVLVPTSSSDVTLNTVLRTYPDLLEPEQVEWAKLVYSAVLPGHEGFRLYRIVTPPTSIVPENASEVTLPPELRGKDRNK